VSDHLHRLQTVYDERFAREYGPWRPVVAQVADKFLACGVLEHGFARIRCDACAHEYLLALSCKCRYFRPSCHTKRLAIWTQWLDATLLAPVPHRQVVLTIPKRLRAYCLYRRRLLGEIARVAARSITAAIRTLTGERALAVGIVACLQTHGSRANWHPHLHLLVTDGGFRPDGTVVSWPVLGVHRRVVRIGHYHLVAQRFQVGRPPFALGARLEQSTRRRPLSEYGREPLPSGGDATVGDGSVVGLDGPLTLALGQIQVDDFHGDGPPGVRPVWPR